MADRHVARELELGSAQLGYRLPSHPHNRLPFDTPMPPARQKDYRGDPISLNEIRGRP